VDSEEIKKQINELRDSLNLLMSDNYRDNYEKVLQLSIKIDHLISSYCKLESNKI